MRTATHIFALRDKQGRHYPIYTAWVNMRQRCNNSNKWDYKFYGGRGISVCERWDKFENFYDDMGESYQAHKAAHTTTTLDRIDVNKGYSPDNCTWANRWVQSNNRTYNRPFTYQGKTQTLGAWSKELPIKATWKQLYKRLVTRSWDIERAFTQPLTSHKLKS